MSRKQHWVLNALKVNTSLQEIARNSWEQQIFFTKTMGLWAKITKWGSWKSWERPNGRTNLGSDLCCAPGHSSFFSPAFLSSFVGWMSSIYCKMMGHFTSDITWGTKSMYVGFCPFLFHDSKNSQEDTSLVVLKIEKKNPTYNIFLSYFTISWCWL